jgi:flagellar FliL protein
MAEEKKAEPDAAVAKPRRSLKGTLLICGFMGMVVAVECVLAFMFIPDADDVARVVKQKVKAGLPKTVGGNTADLTPQAENDSSAVGVPLGDYSITISQANSSLSLRVDFQLFGTVLEKEMGKLETAFERHKHRFRENIILKIRDSSTEDLSDPSLGLIKRRILETSNTVLGTAILQSVVFSQFSYVEQ